MSVWELEDIHIPLPEYSTDLRQKSFPIRCLYSLVKWNSFRFSALCCTLFWFCFLCLLSDVHLSHLINITYTGYIQTVVLRRFRYRYGFTKEIFHIKTIIDSVTYDLFNKVKASNHCLCHLLLPNDHCMMHSESEDISFNYLSAYTNFTSNLSL